MGGRCFLRVYGRLLLLRDCLAHHPGQKQQRWSIRRENTRRWDHRKNALRGAFAAAIRVAIAIIGGPCCHYEAGSFWLVTLRSMPVEPDESPDSWAS